VDPRDVLPHRPPFLLVDEIDDVTPGESATGRWRLTGEEAFFAGHFPGRPTLPGVLMVEALAQVAGVAMLGAESMRGKLGLFGGIDRARFRRQVGPGDELVLEARITQLASRAAKAEGTARVGDGVACEAQMLFIVVPA
jgi:3-hydroxyacyl-[acyl-carrier-protein] dehydratase